MLKFSEKTPARMSLLIWDTEGEPPLGEWVSVFWREFISTSQPDAVSIPELIESNADSLRRRYLAWIYDLGETAIQGKRLVEFFELRPGFSYWWMTLFVEKCNYSKSMQINDAIRLMAFDTWAKNRSINSVVLATANKPLAECMRLWCASLGVTFKWQRIVKPAAPRSWVKRICQATPHVLQALAWLPRHLINRWPLRGIGLKEWQQTDGRVTFFSYLSNLVPDAMTESRYESRFWGHLPETLLGEACKTNWLHLYVKDALLPTVKQAAVTLCAFNKTGQGVQYHVTLDTFLNLRVVIRTLRDWTFLVWVGVRLSKEVAHAQASTLNLWPLFEEDWQASMFGAVAMSNLLNLNLFESALECLPQQQCGVYLQENQGWEFGLIQAWQAVGHGRLIGAPHSTVRYWDLRYFFDSRSYSRTGCYDLPMPNQVAFNGPTARDAYENGGYPVDDMVEVEALRYLYLGDSNDEAVLAQTPKEDAIQLLVLGDYLPGNTEWQMNLLLLARPMLPAKTVITVKPHPNCPVQPADYPGLSMTITMEPIAKLLAECDVAYSNNATSAAVDAYCAGVPIVSVLDPSTMNLSPLRGCAGVLFASTPEELAAKLLSAASAPRLPSSQQEFFTIDPQLPRWRKLLLNSLV
jgi:surface carbohydrate biosynthesis protein (TIGR04326 family)